MYPELEIRGAAVVTGDVRVSQSGKSVFFKLETTGKGLDGNQETYEFFASHGGKGAEWAAQNLTPGDKIHIKGYLRTRRFTNQQGEDKAFTEVYVRQMDRLRRADGGQQQQQAPVQPQQQSHPLDEIPF